MANSEHLKAAKSGPEGFAKWREANPETVLDLTAADLSGADLRGARLRDAGLRGADLSGARLTRANLKSAILRKANLTGANLAGARLDMADCDLMVITDKRPTQGRGRIPLHQDDLRPLLLEQPIETCDRAFSHLRQALVGCHDIQVMGRGDAKDLEGLIQHIPMLSADTDDGREVSRAPLELTDHRSQLDDLWPGAHDRHDRASHRGPRLYR